jgi:hypothetical protein
VSRVTGSHRLVRQGQDRRKPPDAGNLLMVAPFDMFGELSIFDPGPHVVGDGGNRSACLHDGPPRPARVDGKRPEIAEQPLRVWRRAAPTTCWPT